MRKRSTVSIMLFLIVICLSCSNALVPPTFTTGVELETYQQVTLEEASDLLGVVLPKPAYLPKGLQVKEVYIKYYPQGKSTVLIFFSDNWFEKQLLTYTDQKGIARLRYEIECKIQMQIDWMGSDKLIPIKPPPGLETVEIDGRVGYIREKTNVNTLVWQIPEFKLALSISKDAAKEELVRIAESVSQ